MKIHRIAIICKSCQNQWSLQIPLTGNLIEVFAAVCDCGALLIGNYNFEYHQSLKEAQMQEADHKKIYLTNGHFEILNLSEDEIHSLPTLNVE